METSNRSGLAAGWPLTRAPEDLIRPPQVPSGRVLVLAPHADDEVLASGGLIQVHVDRGDAVRVVYLTDGSRGGFRTEKDEEYVALREAEARAGLEVLGVRDCAFLAHPDRALSTAEELSEQIAGEFRTFRPDVVLVPAPFEIHPDHLAAGMAVATAIDSVRTSAEGAGFDPRILMVEIGAPHVANWILDISGGELMDKKVRALGCHASQLADADFEDKMRALNRYRTVNCGEREVRYAEGYLELRADDFPELLAGLARLLPLVERSRPSATWAGNP